MKLHLQPVNGGPFNTMKTLDTRDLNKRKEELEELKEAVETAQDELDQHKAQKPSEDEDGLSDLEEWEDELETLESALSDAKGEFGTDEESELEELEEIEGYCSDFRHGETMIPVDDFEEYARELAEDIGAINRDASWPLYCIDWEKAAKELAMDYTEVEYLGTSYYIR